MDESVKNLSLSAIGLDSPGLVSKITTTVFEMGGNIIDMEENCRKGLFSIFIAIDLSASDYKMEEVANALYAVGEDTGLKVIVGIYDENANSYKDEKENHIITLLGEDRPGVISRVSTLFHKYNVNIENSKMIARGVIFSMEMSIDTSKIRVAPVLSREKAIQKMKEELKKLCRQLNQSLVIQSEDTYRRAKKLVVFDVESSLIQDKSLNDFLEKVESHVRIFDARRHEGKREDNVIESLMKIAQRLKGSPLANLEKLSDILQLTPGAIELIEILKSMGFKIALLSSGLDFFIKKVFESAGVDYAFSNVLKCDENGLITGEMEDPIINRETKCEFLEFIMKLENIRPDQVIAISDGSTQSHFVKNAGLSIAFKPDAKVVNTDGILNGGNIMNMLYCLGISRVELDNHFKAI